MSSSYYMGISYRPTQPPNPQLQFNKSADMFNRQFYTSNENSVQKNEGIIHARKRKKRIEQIAKFRSPYISRKQSQIMSREGKITRNCSKTSSCFEEIMKVSKIKVQQGQQNKINLIRNESTQSEGVRNDRRNSQVKQLEEVSKLSVSIKLQTKMPEKIVNKEENGLFNHFPSPLFRDSANKYIKKTQKHLSTKLSSFFFPSNKVKTQNERNKPKQSRSYVRPSSCSHNNQSFSKKFNFDGTLQNYKLKIPQRPKTADCRKKQKEYYKKLEILNYTSTAKACIEHRQKRKMDKQLKILPWIIASDGDFLNRSECSSIRQEFKILL